MHRYYRKPESVMAQRWWYDVEPEESNYIACVKPHPKKDGRGTVGDFVVNNGDWVVQDGGRIYVVDNEYFQRHFQA